MTNEKRLALCKEIRWQDEHGNYPFTYMDEKGKCHKHLIDSVTGNWVYEKSKNMADLLDAQFYQDAVDIRNKLTKILRRIRQ